MDQTTAIVVTALIIAVSTLIAAFGGTFLNNVGLARKAKKEKKEAVVEEVFSIILKIDNSLNIKYTTTIDRGPRENEDFLEILQMINDQTLRTNVLTRLYTHELRSLVNAYNRNISEHINTITRYNKKNATKQSLDEAKKDAEEARKVYKKALLELTDRLENMVG
jgi:hypothetical protein